MLKVPNVAAAMVFLLLGEIAIADPFIGLKLAFIDMDGNVKENPFNVAVDLGYSLDTWIADLSVIAEHNRTVDSGDTQQGESLEINANAIYLLWKTTRSMYVSLRAGAVQNEVVTAGDSEYRTSWLWGAGIGQVIGRTRLQIEYTSLAGDAGFFGIGLEFDE